MSARRKGPAFDPSRLDDIDDVLGAPIPMPPAPPPEPQSSRASKPAASEQPPPAWMPAEERVDQLVGDSAPGAAEAPVDEPAPAAPDPARAPVRAPAQRRSSPPTRGGTTAPRPRQPRGLGGRPPARVAERAVARQAVAGKVPVAVRVPPQLYNDVNNDLLAGPERPSYGQLVIWTLEDHAEEVAEQILAAREAAGRQRRPRGHRMAAPDVQITLRLNPAERDFLDEHARGIDPDDGKPVTRTEVAIACLRVALNRAE